MIAMTLLSASAFAQTAREPEKGSAERNAIINALRIPVERDLKQKIVFNIDHFKTAGNWAFISGSPQTPGGGRPDYNRTRYRGAVDSGAFDNNFFALLNRVGGKWRVATYAIGCTDVCWLDWPSKRRVPVSIFPFTG
jgi:hypothetical protein